MIQRSPASSTVYVVDANILTGGLLAEKLQQNRVRAFASPSLAKAAESAAAGLGPAVLLWAFNWQYQAGEIAEMKRWTAARCVVVLGAGCNRAAQAQLLLSGARGFVDQSEPLGRLLTALEQVARGARAFSDDVLSDGIDLLSQRPVADAAKPLTERERQIIEHIVRGHANKEIAAALRLSESTVKSHLQAIFSKLGVNSRLALAMHAVQGAALGGKRPAEAVAPLARASKGPAA